MKRFTNILVGIDLSEGDRLVSDRLPPPTVEAVKRALWLAKLNSARITFFHALDVSCCTQRLIEENVGADHCVLDDARDALRLMTAKAVSEGVNAEMEVQFGKSWLEIIRQVLRKEHDLVVAGTRHQGAMKSFLMGSTGIKLLRKCPCPVWITQAGRNEKIKSILVAHDLRQVGDLALDLGCSMSRLHGAQLHVLHSLELPEDESAFPAGVSAEKMVQHRTEATNHIEAQLQGYEVVLQPQIHLASEPTDVAILKCIEKYDIELVTMGTIARTGVAGFITGNTAERLLPQLPCSVLAVKPAGFVSPVTL